MVLFEEFRCKSL